MSAMGASEIARAFLTVQVDDRALAPGLDKTRDTVVKSAQDMAMLASQALSALGLGMAANNALNAAAAFETTSVSIEVMLGSLEKAQALIADLNKFSLVTPFTPTQVNEAAQTLLTFQFGVEDTMEALQFLGDISAASGADLKGLARTLGQIKGSGVLNGEDLNKLIDAGFNPLISMAEKAGKSYSEMKKEMSLGKVTFEQVRESMISATSAGGQFFQMMAKQAETFDGLKSTVDGMVQSVMKGIGLKMLPIAKQLVSVAISLAQTWIEWDAALGGSLSTITMVAGGLGILMQSILGATMAAKMMGITWSTVVRGMLMATGVGAVAVVLGLVVVGVQKLITWLMSLEYVQNAIAKASDTMNIAMQHAVVIWEMATGVFRGLLGVMNAGLQTVFPGLRKMPESISEAFVFMIAKGSEAFLTIITWARVFLENWETVWDVAMASAQIATLQIVDYFSASFKRILSAADALGRGLSEQFRVIGQAMEFEIDPITAAIKMKNILFKAAGDVGRAFTDKVPENPALQAMRDRMQMDIDALVNAKDALDKSTQVQREEETPEAEKVEEVAKEAEAQIKVALDDGFFGFDAFQRSFQDQLLKPSSEEKNQTEELKKGNKFSADSLAELKSMNSNLQNSKLEVASA